MGGKPSRGTKKDMRLKENKPPATGGSGAWSSQNKPKPPVKKG